MGRQIKPPPKIRNPLRELDKIYSNRQEEYSRLYKDHSKNSPQPSPAKYNKPTVKDRLQMLVGGGGRSSNERKVRNSPYMAGERDQIVSYERDVSGSEVYPSHRKNEASPRVRAPEDGHSHHNNSKESVESYKKPPKHYRDLSLALAYDDSMSKARHVEASVPASRKPQASNNISHMLLKKEIANLKNPYRHMQHLQKYKKHANNSMEKHRDASPHIIKRPEFYPRLPPPHLPMGHPFIYHQPDWWG